MGYELLNDFLTNMKFMKFLLPLHLIGPFLISTETTFFLFTKETEDMISDIQMLTWNWSFCITVSMLHTT